MYRKGLNTDKEVQALIDKYELVFEASGDYRMTIIGVQEDKEVGLSQIIPYTLLYDEIADEHLREIRLSMWEEMSRMTYKKGKWEDKYGR